MVSPMRTLAIVLICGVLAACGPMSESSSTGSKKAPPRGATTPTPPAPGPAEDPPEPPPLPEYPDLAIDQTYLAARLRELSGAVAVVINGQSVRIGQRSTAAGLDQARAYLAQEYTKLGFAVSQHTGWGGTNFIADKRGADDRYLVLSAHIDAVPGSPGADDDGSGVVMSLAIAQALAQRSFTHGLRVVGFDAEELGLVGSAAYAQSLVTSGDANRMIADIQVEMGGYDPNNLGAFHVIDCNRADSTPLSARVLAANAALGTGLVRAAFCTEDSDHASFWNIGKPAVVISESFFSGTPNPCYHRTCDTVDGLNFAFMAKMTRAIGATVSALLEPRR
jgi:hypothetical protein